MPDEQDQSEAFDETHLDDEGDAEFLLDEADDVLDVTVVRVAQEAGLGGLVDDQWTGLAMRTG